MVRGMLAKITTRSRSGALSVQREPSSETGAGQGAAEEPRAF